MCGLWVKVMGYASLWAYSWGMGLTEFMFWKAVAVVVLAFLAGLFGFIDNPPEEERRDKRLE